MFPIAIYATETWTQNYFGAIAQNGPKIIQKKTDKSKIEAFEMWVYRIILRVSCTKHRANQSILEELNINDRLTKLT